MSEGDYEYECMRCELLGLPKPEKPLPGESSDGIQKVENSVKTEQVDDGLETDEAENLEVNTQTALQGEELGRTAGGLDELNSILTITQKKLNKFKGVCSSLTSLLKIRVGSSSRGEDSTGSSRRGSDSEPPKEGDAGNATPLSPASAPGSSAPHRRDLEANIGSQLDKIESMLSKAEHAEMSMLHQNKQMKSYLNK